MRIQITGMFPIVRPIDHGTNGGEEPLGHLGQVTAERALRIEHFLLDVDDEKSVLRHMISFTIRRGHEAPRYRTSSERAGRVSACPDASPGISSRTARTASAASSTSALDTSRCVTALSRRCETAVMRTPRSSSPICMAGAEIPLRDTSKKIMLVCTVSRSTEIPGKLATRSANTRAFA